MDKSRKTTKKVTMGTSLAVQWLRLHTPNAGDTDSIPGQGTKILHAAWHGPKKPESKAKKRKWQWHEERSEKASRGNVQKWNFRHWRSNTCIIVVLEEGKQNKKTELIFKIIIQKLSRNRKSPEITHWEGWPGTWEN